MLALALLFLNGCARRYDEDAPAESARVPTAAAPADDLTRTMAPSTAEEVAFWSSFSTEAAEVSECYESVEVMRAASGAVVVAAVREMSFGRVFQAEDVAFDRFTYPTIVFDVQEWLAGAPEPLDHYVVEFVGGDAAAFERFEAGGPLPTGEQVLFLREKRGEGEAGLHRTVSPQGLIVVDAAGQLHAPMTGLEQDFIAVDIRDEEVGTLLDALRSGPTPHGEPGRCSSGIVEQPHDSPEGAQR